MVTKLLSYAHIDAMIKAAQKAIRLDKSLKQNDLSVYLSPSMAELRFTGKLGLIAIPINNNSPAGLWIVKYSEQVFEQVR